MEDIAQMVGLTPKDRADRARPAFALYVKANGTSEIRELIADLMHLADMTTEDGGITEAAMAAAAYSMHTGEGYLAQVRHPGEDNWWTMGGTDSKPETAALLVATMEMTGVHIEDLADYVNRLVAGEVLKSPSGHEWRVISGSNHG